MYTYEIADILFLIKSIRNPTNSININNYITFYTDSSKCTNYNILMVLTASPDICT